MGLYYACPHCKSARKKEVSDKKQRVVYYDCGTTLTIEHYNGKYYWRWKCRENW